MYSHQNIHSPMLFHELDLNQAQFYLVTTLFALANVFLPVLLHQFPRGGMIFLPIYFFTLIAGYKFGWKVGATTALASVSGSFLLTGMPPLAILPFVLFKSVLLGIFSGVVAKKSRLPLMINLLFVVVLYQLGGFLFEWSIVRDINLALQDIFVGYIGLILQILGGTILLNTEIHLWKRNH